MAPRNITTVIFDCDNTLVQSEPIGFEVSAEITNEILESRGIHNIRFTGPQLQREFVGMTFQAMMLAILAKYNFAEVQLTPTELDTYAGLEDARVIAKMAQPGKLQPCTGVNEVLAQLQKQGTYRLAVVSSSAMARIQASLTAAGQANYFAAADVFSATSSMPSPISKPDPAIYLHALGALGAAAGKCVAIEDSRSGVLSAVRAGIPTVGYTGAYAPEEREGLARTLREAGCLRVVEDWAAFPACLAALEKGEEEKE